MRREARRSKAPGGALALRLAAAAAAGGWLTLAAAPGLAQTWTWEPSLGVQETLTNNVNLTPSEIREGDLVTQITPSLRLSERGSHTRLDGFITLPVLLYVRTGSENNQFYPTVDLRGTAELVDKFFYVDGLVSVTQQFFNPFGAQPVDLANSTQNRYRSDTYYITPYIRGVTPNNTTYELRNINSWTNLSGAPINTDDSHTVEWTGNASNTQNKLGWRANFDIADVKFNNQNTIKTRLVRFEPIYAIDPQLRLTASGGYEDNTYTLSSSHDVIYGVGLEWRPDPRTTLVGNWEHRFFGSSYLFTFDHRTPLSVTGLRFSRNITTYPQQLAALPAGVPIGGLLDALFLSTYPDPAERARAVEQFLQSRGLSGVLSNPVNLYSQAILLQQTAIATFGLLGARNSVFFSVYNQTTEQIAGSGEVLPPAFSFGNDIKQTGGSVVWTHNFSPSLVMTTTAAVSRSVTKAPFDGWTNQGGLNATLSTPISTRTNVYAGARYQLLNTNVGSDYTEVAVFAGISHSFR